MSEILQSLRENTSIDPKTVTEEKTHEAITAVQSEARENLTLLRKAIDAQLADMNIASTGASGERQQAYRAAMQRFGVLKLSIANREAALAPGDLQTAGQVLTSTERISRKWTGTATSYIGSVPLVGTAFFLAGMSGVWGWGKSIWKRFFGKKDEKNDAQKKTA